ncbi:MAG: hypothetical protein JNK10_02130 [Cyclobacteriaceae bacterium]|nr:hypothetical protein [Cyclobacteriaceae bacterium]
MNKLRILTALLVMLVATTSFGQGLKVTAFGGYTIQDKVYGYYGDLVIGDGGHFGGMLSYEKSSNLSVDLTYSYQSTTFKVNDYSFGTGNASGNYSGSVSYLMIGSSASPDFNAKFAPYGGFMVGAAIFSSKVVSEQWKFAVGGKLGAIYHVNDKFGIVIQTQLMVPVQGVGFTVGCGTGGCGSGVGTTSSATQLGFTGGVEIKLGN